MNKKFKIIGIAAAALLAVAPVVSTTVNAADTTQTNNSSSNTQNNQTVTTTNTQSTSSTATTDNVNSENPVITYNGKSYDHDQEIDLGDASFNYLPVGDYKTDLPTEISKVFTATASSTDKTPLKVGIDNLLDFDNQIAGKYRLKISATNKAGKTTQLSFILTVGPKDSGAKYVAAEGEDGANPQTYRIENGKVKDAGGYVGDPVSVATFGTITVNGISYTRLNSADSNLYIETSAVNGTYPQKPANKSITKTLMHTALAYNGDGHATGKKYYAFRSLTLSPYTNNINGSTYYTVLATADYIKASNIDGTKRTLKKNAYIYSSSRRRTSFNGSWKLTKGSTVTTYGSSFKFRNGKRYYRIGGPAKQYVRVENFD